MRICSKNKNIVNKLNAKRFFKPIRSQCTLPLPSDVFRRIGNEWVNGYSLSARLKRTPNSHSHSFKFSLYGSRRYGFRISPIPLLKGTLMQIWKSANIFVLTWKWLCRRFHIKTPFTLWNMRTWDMWNVCLQTFRNNRMR